MTYSKIKKINPFEGAPSINTPKLYGASPEKPFLYRIPVSGQRPVTISVENLPSGLSFDENIISGSVNKEGSYDITITASNDLGTDRRILTIEIAPDGVQLTPLMGVTSWNVLFKNENMCQENIVKIAHQLIATGLADFGYSFVNADSGWQGEYGGKFDAIMPNEKFPDMKKMCDDIHSLGLKAGIYSTPMKTAWGCPENVPFIPGCTRGERDIRFSGCMTGIGKDRCEQNNANQWADWGFDYLKYDWDDGDAYNADFMKQALLKTSRDFACSISTSANIKHADYWKTHWSSYRSNGDSFNNFECIKAHFNAREAWAKHMCKGHFFDMDMMEIGEAEIFDVYFPNNSLTEDEELFAYSMRAFFSSPLQISCFLDRLTEFEMSLLCNKEIIAINQDTLFKPALTCMRYTVGDVDIRVYKKKITDGYAYAIFNLGDGGEDFHFELEEKSIVRDAWLLQDIGEQDFIHTFMHPHTAKIYIVK